MSRKRVHPCDEEQEMEEVFARSRSLDEMDDMEDVCLRTSGKDPRLVASVATTGPPWHDEYTGRELAHEDEEKAMMKEMASHASFGVGEWVRESLADGFDIVNCRWLLKQRPTDVKARLIAQQFILGDKQDTYAATPTITGQRLLLALATRYGMTVLLGDVSTAFLLAELVDRVYARPPANLRRLQCA